MNMKPQEILFASALIAVVAGVGTTLAVQALRAPPARVEAQRALDPVEIASAASEPSLGRGLDELRMENNALRARLAALEGRLEEVLSSRRRLETGPPGTNGSGPAAAGRRADAASLLPLAATPDFVATVGEALDTIKAREEAEREARRKELQAQRIEDRVSKLQLELGLNNRQASELRTALIAQDDKRETLFTSMRDGSADPRDMRDSFRTLRDETHATIQLALTPEQFEAYQKSDETDFGRRGFEPGFPGGRPPDDGPGGRRGRGQ